MSIWDVVQAFRRHWSVVVVAVAVALLVSHAAVTAPGAYWSRAEVTFLAPTSTINPNALRTTSSDLVVTAAVVARRVNGNVTWNKMADPAATIVGQGNLDGWSVHVPDHGGQWSRVYPRQVLDVQVSGPTAEAVRQRQAALLARIDAELADLQEGVVDAERITTKVVPATPPVHHVTGSRIRALAMTWVLCGAGALAAVLLLEPYDARWGWPVRVRRPRRRPVRPRRAGRAEPAPD